MSATVPAINVTCAWQDELRQVITDVDELLQMLKLDRNQLAYSAQASADFPLKVPRSFAARMRPGDPQDPLLLQVLSQPQEMQTVAGYTSDPVGESAAVLPRNGVVHKYHGRVLLIVSGGCAINCRYCFRRHFPYEQHQNSRQDWAETLRYVRQDSSISEVILSGGDPLVATDTQLAELTAQIGAIAHVRRLRIHSRLPVVIPSRVTEKLIRALSHPDLQSVFVLHCNHANEIDESVKEAVSCMTAAGITVLNQSVLLAGINDSVAAQQVLSEALFNAGIVPYYLHVLDKVAGAAHFDVDEQTAQQMHARMRATLPGYLVPRLVREIAGEPGKTLLT